jgi:hypothetical protein
VPGVSARSAVATAPAQSTTIVSSSHRTLDVSNTLSSFVTRFELLAVAFPAGSQYHGTARRQSSRKNSAPFQRECGESGVQATARGNAPRLLRGIPAIRGPSRSPDTSLAGLCPGHDFDTIPPAHCGSATSPSAIP